MTIQTRAVRPTVCLVTPFAAKDDCAPVRRTPLQWARNRARRAVDWFRWRVQGRWEFHFSTYEECHNSNRGDIAIRIASRALLERTFQGRIQIVEAGWHDFHGPFLDWVRANVRLVVIAGGGYLFLDDNYDLPERVQTHFALLQTVPCPVVGFSLGVNRLLVYDGNAGCRVAASSRTLAERLIARLAEVSVRDAGAARTLQGLDDGRTIVLPDPALFLDPAPVIGLPTRTADDGLWLGVNLFFHGKEVSRLLGRQFPVVIKVLRDLARTRRCRFFYFVHYDSERLIPRLFAQHGLPMTVVDRPPAEMVSWYGLLDAHLSGMLHSSILACAADTPVLNLAYDVKSFGFYELMELGPWVMPAVGLEADQLSDRLQALIDHRADLRVAIARRKRELWTPVQAFLDRIPPLVRS
jgi:hypothetical protein